MTQLRSNTMAGLLLCLLVASPASAQIASSAQPAANAGDTTTEGVVVSSARSTLVVRAADGHYELFVLDANTTRPEQIPAQSKVTVVSRKAAGDQAANALLVRITAPPAPPETPAEGTAKPGQPPVAKTADEPVPQSVRQLEDSIKRQTRRFHIGVRGGLALDPELVIVGAQMQLGPFFKSSFIVRPTLDLGFGEVTTLVAFNLDGLYQLPSTTSRDHWKMYVGGGPGFNFSKLAFTDESGNEEDFSFSDLVFDGGFNVVIGLHSRSGMFVELRSTAYSTPHMQFILGYNF